MIDELCRAAGFNVSRETFERLNDYAALLTEESQRQNLISKSTIESLWTRHILDSAQLMRHVPRVGNWLDIGSGAGLPGIVVAVLSQQETVLVEPRRLRAEFLVRCVKELGLPDVQVRCAKVERLAGRYDVITARAVASTAQLFSMSHHLSHPGTRWVLPKGRSGAKELAEARCAWQGRIWTEPSITEGDAVILLAEGVHPRGGASR